MRRAMMTRTGHLALGAVFFAAATTANAVVQSYNQASGSPGTGADHPGFGFFQADFGLWDTGLDSFTSRPPAGEFQFAGSDGAFEMAAFAMLDSGRTGQTGDHAGFFRMDYNPAPPARSFGSFWFGGIGNDAGPLPPVPNSNILVFMDVLTQAGTPFEFRIESDYTSQNNGFRFRDTGTGTWQTVGGRLSQATSIGTFNPADPNLALLFAFGHGNEITAVDDGTDPNRVPTVRVDNLTITVDQASWNSDASGTWSDNARWSPFAPDGANAVAIFGSAITAPRTVTVDIERWAGDIQFNNTNSYTLGGTGTLNIRRFGSSSLINVVSGNHSIDAPLALHNDVSSSVATGSTLTLNNLLPSNASVNKTDGGTLRVNNVRAAGLSVQGGTVAVLANGTDSGVSRVGSLTIGAGAALDVNNNSVVVDYSGASPLAQIAAAVATGYAGGTWAGPGINSSAAAATPNATAVGFAEASSIFTSFPATFQGQQVDNTSVLVRYTRVGDANLDGTTNIGDFSLLAANFNQPGNWSNGDFNYDGLANIGDFSLLAANFNQSVAAVGGRAAVPEPAALLGGVVMGMACLARRRR